MSAPRYIDDFLYVTRAHAEQAATLASNFREMRCSQAEAWQVIADALNEAADKIKAQTQRRAA